MAKNTHACAGHDAPRPSAADFVLSSTGRVYRACPALAAPSPTLAVTLSTLWVMECRNVVLVQCPLHPVAGWPVPTTTTTLTFFEQHLFVFVICRKILGFYLDNQDPSFKENRVSVDGDKKEGFETILW